MTSSGVDASKPSASPLSAATIAARPVNGGPPDRLLPPVGAMRSKLRLPSLDGLRGISILLVIISHLADNVHGAPWPVRALLGFFGNGRAGVSVFFVISGMLITWLLLQERESRGRIDLVAFYQRRALRIWPAYFTFILVVAILAMKGVVPAGLHDLVAAGLFVWNYAGGATDQWTLAHTWSLSIEEQFYLLWPLCLVMAGDRSRRRLALGIIAVSPLLRVAIYLWEPAMRGRIDGMLHTRADSLMFGCLLAVVLARPGGEGALRRFVRWRLHYAAVLFLLIGSPLLEQQFRGAYLLPFGYSLEGAAIAAIVIWLVLDAESPIGRLMNSYALVWLGVLSYSLYLWQQIFTHEIPGVPGVPVWIRVPALVFVALLSYRLIEQPALKLKSRLRRV